MGWIENPQIVTSNLVLLIDPLNPRSAITNTTSLNLTGDTRYNLTVPNTAYQSVYSNGAILSDGLFGLGAAIPKINDNTNSWTSNNFTFEIWITGTTATFDWTTIATCANTTLWNNGWGVTHQQEANKSQFSFWINSYNVVSNTSFIANSAAGQKHVAVTYDTVTLRVFVNGVHTNSTANNAGITFGANTWLYMGGQIDAYGLGCPFQLPKYYNRALSNNEVYQNFSAHRSRFGV